MTAISSSSSSIPWSPSRLEDEIFVNLMENGYNDDAKSNKYIDQMIDKFEFFRIKSPENFYEISFKDLDSEVLNHIKDHTKDCKTTKEKYRKLDGIFTKVIAQITKQAESAILSQRITEDTILLKVSLNSIREFVSQKWKLIGGEKL